MHSENCLNLDYQEEAACFARYRFPIIDSHAHINGDQAVNIYRQAADLYGISLTYSMTYYEEIDRVKEILGDKVRFITMPQFTEEEKYYYDTSAYIRFIEKFYAKGSRIMKFWSPPRAIDYGENVGIPDLLKFDSPRRQEIMRQVYNLGMVFMVHVGDPDIWFSTKYSDSKRYRKKIDQYKPLQKALDKYDTSFIAAHMGGWPENLEFLDKMLELHGNLYLDTSATKWMVRELSKYSREELSNFFMKWKGRILFGSDIVSKEVHILSDSENKNLTVEELRSRAFDLYSSRYWALRTLFESKYKGKSPIADPDLALIDPARYQADSSADMRGINLPQDVLESLYYKASHDLLEPLHTA